MVVPDEDLAWLGRNDAYGRASSVDDLKGLTMTDLSFNLGPMGFHFPDTDGFHEKIMIDELHFVKLMFFNLRIFFGLVPSWI